MLNQLQSVSGWADYTSYFMHPLDLSLLASNTLCPSKDIQCCRQGFMHILRLCQRPTTILRPLGIFRGVNHISLSKNIHQQLSLVESVFCGMCRYYTAFVRKIQQKGDGYGLLPIAKARGLRPYVKLG